MAKQAGAQENAKKILDIYKHFNSKEGDVLRANNFMAVGSSKGWNMKDLQQGLNFAVENRWLKIEPTGWLKLTESGFKEM